MRLIDAISLLDNHTKTIRVRGQLIGYVTFEDISNAPTIDAEPVRHGHWEIDEKRYGNKDPHCSICRAILEGDVYKCRNNYYCYHCGAKMDEEEKE